MLATAEAVRSVNPQTALLLKKDLTPLLVHPQTLPTTGFLAHIIPGLNVNLRQFIGVWEGETTVRGTSKESQPAIIRIELGREFSPYAIKSSIDIVGLVDRRRERWIINEVFNVSGSAYHASFTLEMGFVGGMTSKKLGKEFATGSETIGIRLNFSEPLPNKESIAKPGQLPLHTTEDTSYRFYSGFHSADDSALTLLDLRDSIIMATLGIAAPEIRSRLTTRTPIALECIGTQIHNVDLVQQ